MSFDLMQLGDAALDAGATASAAGKRTTTTSIPPRSNAVDASMRDGLGLGFGRPRDKDPLIATIERLADHAEALGARDLPPGDACAAVAALIMAAVPPAQELARLAATSQATVAQAQAHVDDAFFFAQRAAEHVLTVERAGAAPLNDAAVLRSLDRLAVVAHRVAAAGRADPRATLPLGALGSLGAVTGPLGWTAPRTTQEATAARLVREPCAPDPGDARDPERCTWTRDQRQDHLDELVRRLNALMVDVAAACAEEAETLSAMVERDQRIAEAVAEIVLEALVSFIPGGGKAAGAVGKAAAVGVAAQAGTSATRAAMAALRSDIGKAIRKALTRKAAKALASHDDDPRRSTVALIKQLPERFLAAVRAIDFASLDDETIRDLEIRSESTSARVRADLHALIAAYRSQIEPLGATRVSFGLPSPRKTVTRAARIRVNGAASPRLAMVEHSSDLDPQPRHDHGAQLAAGADLAEHLHLISPETDERIHAAADQSGDTYTFIRWLTPPPAADGLDLAALASVDALDLDATQVRDLPLGALLDTASGAP